jgi:hypothetical protein
MLGLNDTHIAHADIQLGHGWTGHEKFDIDYVLEQQPDVILLGTLGTEPLTTVDQYAATTFPFPAQQGLIDDPRTFDIYHPVAMDVTGDDGWLNMLVAKHGAKDVWLALIQQDGFTIDKGKPS